MRDRSSVVSRPNIGIRLVLMSCLHWEVGKFAQRVPVCVEAYKASEGKREKTIIIKE